MILKIVAASSLAASLIFGIGAALGSAQEKPGFGGSASITGTVTFTDGTPATNRPVEWRPNGDPNGGSTVQTDKGGAFAIRGLTDGEYFIGYFQPDRLPSDKNQSLEVAPDPHSAELTKIGLPLVKRVRIQQGKSVGGIDFVISNIGDERGAGPESGGGETVLPLTGANAVAPPSSERSKWTRGIVVVAAFLAALSGGAVLLSAISRRRSN